MKLIKYWHVKLFQQTQLSSLFAGAGGLSGAGTKLLYEGFSKDKPRFRPGAEFVIDLLTDPHGVESKSIRTCSIDIMHCIPVYEEESGQASQRPVMQEYIKAAIGEGYQPEHEAAITDLSVVDALSDNDLNREYGKCWQWYNMGGGVHETVDKQTSFEQAAEPLIKWLAENVHPHHSVIVTSTAAELLQSEKSHLTEKFLVD